MHARSSHRNRHSHHHHHHHKQSTVSNETENSTTKELEDASPASGVVVGESARCIHHRSSVGHAHHHHQHIRQHSTATIGHNHAPHHHHHHNHHGRHHHHHQNHKKRLVLDTRDNESHTQHQASEAVVTDANVDQQQQNQLGEEDTQFSVNSLGTIKTHVNPETLDEEVNKDRQPMQELNSNVHTHCCPYHERHTTCQHHIGPNAGHDHSKHHHPHHHHHHHHHHGHQDQKKDVPSDSQQQQSSSTKGLSHKHHHHHHHHHGHHHTANSGGNKQRHGKNRVKSSSNANLEEHDSSAIVTAHQHHHHHHHHPHHHAHHHHHHHRNQQNQEPGLTAQDESANKNESSEKQNCDQKQSLEDNITDSVKVHYTGITSNSNCDYQYSSDLAKKGQEQEDDEGDPENKMNLDQDENDESQTGEIRKLHNQHTVTSTSTNNNTTSTEGATNKTIAANEIVGMDMTLNNEGCARLIGGNEASESKKITEAQTNEFQNIIDSIEIEVNEPKQQVSSLANKTIMSSTNSTKANNTCSTIPAEKNDSNEMIIVSECTQQPVEATHCAKESDSNGIGGGASSSNKNQQISLEGFNRNNEGDSMRGRSSEQQDRRIVRQMSSSRENSQKETGRNKRQDQEVSECSPIQSESYQQQSQQIDQPKQIVEFTVPPDRRCRLCWCCCCPCSGLSNRNNAIKSSESKNVVDAGPSNSKCPSSSNIPLEEIRLWGESFDRLMRCEAGRKVFQDFLRCEYSEENILFWIACEELKLEKDAKSVATRARDIYEDYISILSAKEVSLDSRVRDVINNNIKKPTSNIFDEAQLQIYTLMHRDSYPRFINSPMYKKLAQIHTTSRKGST